MNYLRAIYVAFTFFIFLNIIDAYTTTLILEAGGVETNIFFAHMNVHGISIWDYTYKLLVTPLLMLAIIKLSFRFAKTPQELELTQKFLLVLIIIIACYYLYVCITNFMVLEQLQT
ncbi:MAG: hypothetical protein DRP02_12360 [Candidatus Gerdarchaeota archaeon]|nr:MAG: hypothetical protein DRP02_12360 [Candidatus Gerdarchaeota archaeon]